MIVLERAIRFEEVDAANIVFFARFFGYAHEAMEQLFAELEGGYARLIGQRRVGMPAVHAEAEFHAPLRYGDSVRIETTVARLGRRSATIRYRLFRKQDGVLSAEVRHTVVCSDLNAIASCDMPGDDGGVLRERNEHRGRRVVDRAAGTGGEERQFGRLLVDSLQLRDIPLIEKNTKYIIQWT